MSPAGRTNARYGLARIAVVVDPLRRGLLLATLALFMAPTVAQAAKVAVVERYIDPGAPVVQVNYAALSGETNRVTAEFKGREWVVSDSAAPIEPGKGCRAG